MRLRRHQLVAHLELHGWRPGELIENFTRTPGMRNYVLRAHTRIVVWVQGGATEQENAGNQPYFLNDSWRFCEWDEIPGPQLRKMAALTDSWYPVPSVQERAHV